LKEVINEIRITYPYRDWNEVDLQTACNAYVGSNCKGEMQQTMSDVFIKTNDLYIPVKYRRRASEMPRGFYNRATNEWVDSLDATADDWEQGEDARLELSAFIAEAAEPFKSNARELRVTRKRTFRELWKRKKGEDDD